MSQWVNCYCRVKLAVNSDTQEAVAVKIINLEKNPAAAEAVRKEVSGSSERLGLDIHVMRNDIKDNTISTKFYSLINKHTQSHWLA